jgi:putative FmdB family regulatory protein
MPLKEYRCRKCEHSFEILVGRNSSQEVQCPDCSSDEVDQMFGLPGSVRASEDKPITNCRGDGPPCGAPWCGRKN